VPEHLGLAAHLRKLVDLGLDVGWKNDVDELADAGPR
jgi:hypothetical protein